MAYNSRIALTFGDAGENHVGMEMVGRLGKAGSGFTVEELMLLKGYFVKTHIVQFVPFEHEEEQAGVLLIRNYINSKKHKKILEEMNSFEWDKKYWDTRRGRVLNKIARSNIVILDGISQEPDYEHKKGRIIDGNTLETFAETKQKLMSDITEGIGNTKGQNLICEGNCYYDLKKCGIGFHGDAERRKVIALSLGGSSTMVWSWFHNSKPVGTPYTFHLHGGDVYIMSEKAVGHDWKKRSRITMRHAAGAKKYINLDRYSK